MSKNKMGYKNYQIIDTKDLQNKAEMFCWKNMKNKYDQSMKNFN